MSASSELDGLGYGYLASAGAAPEAVVALCRDLTLSWSRWSFQGRILEREDAGELLSAAADSGLRYLFVQPPGHVIYERVAPKDGQPSELAHRLVRELASTGSMAVATALEVPEGAPAVDRCMVVDLAAWDAAGRPEPARRSDGSYRFGGAPPRVVEDAASAYLCPQWPQCAEVLQTIERGGSLDLSDAVLDAVFPEGGAAFLRRIRDLLADCRNAVFLWNLEGYDDLPSSREPDGEPLGALYSVSAGFKPNAILERLGFDPQTRMVFFDYSSVALAIRRVLVEEWDGRDLPAFVEERLFVQFPPDRVLYYLRDTGSDADATRAELEALWQHELADWGGPDRFADHWRRFRTLTVEYVGCDLLRGPGPLLERIRDERSAIWWSNAFASVYSMWQWPIAARTARYQAWVDALAARCPGLQLLGADAINVPVNRVTAAQYADGLRAHPVDGLVPYAVYGRAIRF